MPLDIPIVPLNYDAKVFAASDALQQAIAAAHAANAGGGGGGQQSQQQKKLDDQAKLDAWQQEKATREANASDAADEMAGWDWQPAPAMAAPAAAPSISPEL